MGLVIGDALGVPVEFVSRDELKENPVTDMIGYGTHNQPAGTWSDDSSMAVATMEWLGEIETQQPDYKRLMDKFLSDEAYLQQAGKAAGNYVNHNAGALEKIMKDITL